MRNYGIDLYRIVLTFMVCTLHTLGQGGLLGACESGTINYNILWLFETIAYCAVDGYALISGYNVKRKDFSFTNIINMWFQVFFYSCIFSFIVFFLGFDGDMSIKAIIKSIIPASSCEYWYFSAFLPLCILEPFIVKGLDTLSDDELRISFILIVLVFCFSGMLFDAYKTENGYSFVWLLLLFILGYIIKRLNMFERFKTKTLVLMSALMVLFSWLLLVIAKTSILINYISPTIVFNSIFLLIIFSRLKPNEKIVKILAPLTFGVYLFHNNRIIWHNLKDFFVFAINYNIFALIALVILFALAIYVVGSIIDYIRSKLFKLIKLDKLSIKINELLLETIAKIKNLLFS